MIENIKDMILMLGLNETIDKLTMANSVDLYGHVLRKEDGHVCESVHLIYWRYYHILNIGLSL